MTIGDAPTQEFQAEMAALRNDLAALRHDLAAIAGTAKREAAEGAELIGDAVRKKAEEIGAKGADIASSLGRQVEERPLASVAVAFGVGFLLANLLHRGANGHSPTGR